MLQLKSAGLALTHLRDVAARVWRILRTLFLEVVGFLFLALAGWGALWLVRAFRRFSGEGEALFQIVLVSAFVVMMGGFGISSFWRARRLSRAK